MALKVCFVYPWATFGGVERVLLNRLLALGLVGQDVAVDIVFFHDAGGLAALQAYIDRHDLQAQVQVQVRMPDDLVQPGEHDLVFCIDAPQAIEFCHRRGVPYAVECHTSYAENRLYLRELPASCRAVLTPSTLFSDRIRHEVPPWQAQAVGELRNCVPREIDGASAQYRFPAWTRRPLLYFGRLDGFKNPLALLDAFALIEARRPGLCMPVFCGPATPEIDLPAEIHRRGLSGLCVVLPPVPFASAGALLQMLAAARGVFISPSKGESFGLSAAEAISAGVPVVLSDLAEHRFLVQGHEDRFTYRQGQADDLATQILAVLDAYEPAVLAACQLRERFSLAGFVQDWQALMARLGLAAAPGPTPPQANEDRSANLAPATARMSAHATSSAPAPAPSPTEGMEA